MSSTYQNVLKRTGKLFEELHYEIKRNHRKSLRQLPRYRASSTSVKYTCLSNYIRYNEDDVRMS
ncbi:hypothetical protein PGT21_010810 [Puccinia graminis f. sp. tritici]|uniref:Uncharacterized protein n=1 Tax=Puccinia graminis f. sp. tritici TaxID=56615 RepID=A0A5B0P2W6_PUCGR|nr:hypothetical protein PGTUg99_023898 [Puccinia graminis f. sp. tritici]KAA1095034.1 hypothetical protein PGT21_034806 [Puccinia graminis f. sp. tritici]KAA1118939.1 hypothetical protein PGT21_010810 [Puccinia graminis f. sp. tritici]